MTQRPLAGIQTDNNDPIAAAKQIRDLSLQTTTLHLSWGSIETEPGKFDFGKLEHSQGIRRELGDDMPLPVWFVFPVHMNHRGEIPQDLYEVALDSDEMIDRWERFVAETAPRAKWDEDGALVVIGNEIDIFCDNHPQEREAVTTFLDKAAQIVAKHAPNAKPINTCTYDGFDKPNGEQLIRELNRNTGVASYTWYDLSPAMTVNNPPTPIGESLDRMVALSDGKPVLLQEISMPTGPGCLGDEALQEKRVHELFDALEARNRDQVIAAIWLTIIDWPRSLMTEYVGQQFGAELVENAAFFDFITTLGMVREDGTPKPAAHAWIERAAKYKAANPR